MPDFSDDREGFDVISNEEIAAAFADKTRTYYIGIQGRLGFHAFAAFIEYSFFHPRFGPNSNRDFHYFIVKFGLPHFIFGIPRRFETRTHEIAKRLKLKPQRGVPMMLGGEEEQFPGSKEALTGRRNVYVIESDARAQYNNDPEQQRLIRERESEIVDLLVQRGPVITPHEAAMKLWMQH